MSLAQFETHLIRKGLRTYTIQCHLQRMRQIMAHCPELSYETIESYLTSKKKLGVKGSSLNRLVITVHSYCEAHNLAWGKRIKFFKEEPTYKGVFSDEEIEQLINLECPSDCRQNIWDRWSLWLKVLAFTGMRPNEVSTLTVDQVDWGSNNFILPTTKTVPRRVPIAPNLQEDLKEHLSTCTHYLFPVPSPRGHVWRQGWQKHFALRKKLVGLTRQGLTPNSFRHSFISNLWEEATPLPDIMNIVGHRNPKTTLKYSHLGNKSAQKSILRHSLIRKHTTPHLKLQRWIEEGERLGLFEGSEFQFTIENNKVAVWVNDTI